ncbi:MAG: hypothetical protein HY648_02620 [Acidobacteria bacterium]|nr:hypothetical protein [Acidobacteriota bacterium]
MNSASDSQGESSAAVAQRNASVRYEPEDVPAGTILKSLLVLLLAVMAAQALVWTFYHSLADRRERGTPSLYRWRHEAETTLPPEPRLQGGPGREMPAQEELRRMREEAEVRLHSYGWVDEKAGIARIPIREAMRMVEEKGLDTGRSRIAKNMPGKSVLSAESVRSGEPKR